MEEAPISCANCGKVEETEAKLKTCSACKLVKYCGRDCQIAHRPQHKKTCQKHAAELHEEELFKEPPKRDDCPICFLMLPYTGKGKTFMACCGKMICAGCCHEHELHSNGRVHTCPFCRTPQPPPKEFVKMLEKRADTNDANAVNLLGMKYLNGDHDSSIQKDMVKALTFLQRAAELGSAPACRSLGIMYEIGHGVSKDEAKSKQYFEKGAMAGDVFARFNLVVYDANAGNFDRAIKHWLIAASFGDIRAVESIENEMIKGRATNDQYAQALHQYQVHLDEVKSDQRDKAATFGSKYLIQDMM